MFKAQLRRGRYEIARRLNRFRSAPGYSFTSAVINGKQRVALRDESGRERQIDLRLGTSDYPLFQQMFGHSHYDLRSFARHSDIERRYSEILETNKRPLIVDAGANVGLSALYWRDRYPQAAIIAIEPEPGNFAELQRRMAGDELCFCLNAAIANFNGAVQLEDPGLTECGFRTKQTATGIPAYRLDAILQKAPWDVEPFILKIDIEGFEADLFDDPEIFDAYYVCFIELHDWMLPKQRTSASFLTAFATLNRDFLLHGENIVSIKND
jgi:FkbM family methyltransferase